MKRFAILALALAFLPFFSCKKTAEEVYLGSWYLKSEKLLFLTNDSSSEVEYDQSRIYIFKREGKYTFINHQDSVSNGTWYIPMSNENSMNLDGDLYDILNKEKFSFSLSSTTIGLDSIMKEMYFERD